MQGRHGKEREIAREKERDIKREIQRITDKEIKREQNQDKVAMIFSEHVNFLTEFYMRTVTNC